MAPVARRRRVAVIGLGCIGGSLARALGGQGVDVRAWSSSRSDRERAAGAGVCVTGDDGDGAAVAAAGASQIVLAVPVSSIASAARAALTHAAPDALVLHVGGLQRADSLRLDDVLRRRVLGTHPLAGSHNSGFDASRPDMFVGCSVSIESRAPEESRTTAEWLWRTVGASRIE
jgi:prephenate dehydrogenase